MGTIVSVLVFALTMFVGAAQADYYPDSGANDTADLVGIWKSAAEEQLEKLRAFCGENKNRAITEDILRKHKRLRELDQRNTFSCLALTGTMVDDLDHLYEYKEGRVEKVTVPFKDGGNYTLDYREEPIIQAKVSRVGKYVAYSINIDRKGQAPL